jgi:hypothetical protein
VPCTSLDSAHSSPPNAPPTTNPPKIHYPTNLLPLTSHHRPKWSTNTTSCQWTDTCTTTTTTPPPSALPSPSHSKTCLPRRPYLLTLISSSLATSTRPLTPLKHKASRVTLDCTTKIFGDMTGIGGNSFGRHCGAR